MKECLIRTFCVLVRDNEKDSDKTDNLVGVLLALDNSLGMFTHALGLVFIAVND